MVAGISDLSLFLTALTPQDREGKWEKRERAGWKKKIRWKREENAGLAGWEKL